MKHGKFKLLRSIKATSCILLICLVFFGQFSLPGDLSCRPGLFDEPIRVFAAASDTEGSDDPSGTDTAEPGITDPETDIDPESAGEPDATPGTTYEPAGETEITPGATPGSAEEPDVTPGITPEMTGEPEITPEPTAEPEITPEPTGEPEITPEPTAEPEITPEPTPTPSQNPNRPAPTLRKTSVTLYSDWEPYEIFIDNLDEDAVVTYKSTRARVAEVDKNGVVTPLSKGSATIKIKITDSDGYKYSLKLSVKVKDPYYEVTDSTDVITSQGSYRFRLKRYGSSDEVTWTLTGSQYATIEAVSDTDCVISGKAPGSVILTVSCLDREESFDIRIYEGAGVAYLVSPEKKPFYDSYAARSDYNEYTRDYFLFRSALEKIAVAGGGMLIVSEGTYHITNTLCVPSNTTVLIEDGATIVKTDYTSDRWLTATQSLFQTVAYNHTQTKFTKYNGEHDISFIGQGSATIDLNYIKSTAIMTAHCQNLCIRGITFKNMNTGHFIELDASKNVEIRDNVFTGYSVSPTQRKEAINIDTPDAETHGFTQGWTSYDMTPDKNVKICGNVFEHLETAIGTHKYSEGKYHTNIEISGNTFVDVSTYVVRMMNWKNCSVTDNYFLLWEIPENAEVKAVIINGALNPTVTGNRFIGYTTAISCSHWKNSGSGKIYAETLNKISKKNITAMKDNIVKNCTNNYFEIYPVYGDKSLESRKTYKFTGKE